jgi:hypothetical protein
MAAIRNPDLFVEEFERMFLKQIFQYRYGSGIDVMDRDWDNLIILDACRVDYFAKHNRMDGELQRVVSKGSSSGEFIEGNFSNGTFHDTILVTANPFVEEIGDDVFFRVRYSDVFDSWDDSLKTIPPESIVDITLEMHERYPDKRLVAHFMQPHAPYIGPTGRELSERNGFGVFNPNLDAFDIHDAGIPGAIDEGYVDEHELRQAYAENVEIALDHAQRLVDGLNGKSVITADHGEGLGERGLLLRHYGHSRRLYTPELRIVPWFVISSEDRRSVTTGEPVGFEGLDERTLDSRLHELGYL